MKINSKLKKEIIFEVQQEKKKYKTEKHEMKIKKGIVIIGM